MATHKAKQPEPIVVRVSLATVVGFLSAACLHFGALSGAGAWLATNKDWLAAGAGPLGPIVGAWLARQHVTPVAAPKSADGAKLVEAVEPTPAVSDALAAADAIHSMPKAQ